MPFRKNKHNLLYINKDKSILKDLSKIVDIVHERKNLEDSIELFFSNEITFVITSVNNLNELNHLELFRTAKKDIPIIIYNNEPLSCPILLSKIANIGVQGLFYNNTNQIILKTFLKEIEVFEEKSKNKKFLSMLNNVMDSHRDIIFSIEHEDVLYANKRFFEFFQVDSLKSFHSKYISLQNLILKSPLSEVYLSRPLTTIDFIEYLYSLKEDKRTIALNDYSSGEIKIFMIKISFIKEGYRLFNLVDITDMAKKHSVLEEKANIDELTKIYNRHKFNEVSKNIESICSNYSICILDIDKFKNINDTYGHDGGDEILKELSFFIKDNIRKTDVFARWGGEEFILLLPETNYEEAFKVADTLREKVSNHNFSHVDRLTLSIGISHSSYSDNGINGTRNLADKALYIAKNNGRNLVIGSEEIKVD